MNSYMSWQAMSFVLASALAIIMLTLAACLRRIDARRRQNLVTVGFSALGGSLAGIISSRYIHYLPSLMVCLGVAGLIADRFLLWFEGKQSREQKQ